MYNDFYTQSIDEPEIFWNEIAKDVSWAKAYTNTVKDKFKSEPKWFTDGKINMSFNCLDRNVRDGFGDDVAVIHDSSITRTSQTFTYKQLLTSVSLLAGVMVDKCKIQRGDIVLLYFPMVPECLIAMLACTRIGATYAVVFGGFSVKEFSMRISNVKPKMVMTCNVGHESNEILYYKERLDSALSQSGVTIDYCLVYNRPYFKAAQMKEGVDLDWNEELSKAKPKKAIPMKSNHKMSIIFSSGTTGDPKGFVQLTGPSVVYNKYLMKYIYGVPPKETVWIFSDFSWVIGQCLMSYASLLGRTKTILFEGNLLRKEGKTHFPRILNWYKVSVIVCMPRTMRVLQRNSSEDNLELTCTGLSCINLGGEESSSALRNWIWQTFTCQVFNAWGQTELGGALCRSVFGRENLEEADSSLLLLMPGLEMKIVDRETGLEVPNGKVGRIILKLPTVISMVTTLFNNPGRFRIMYFDKYPGYFDTMDAGIMWENRRFEVVGRDGDEFSVGGARILTTTFESACLQNRDVSEAVVVIYEDSMRGPMPFTFLVRGKNLKPSNREVIDNTKRIVTEIIGEVAFFEHVVIVPEFPTNSNGKVHKGSLGAMANGENFELPATVVNSEVYPTIYTILMNAGYRPQMPT